MKTTEVKTNIEIGGAIITPELIDFLKESQRNDNEDIVMFGNMLADAVCFIGSIGNILSHDAERKKAFQIITDISSIRDYLENLKKP